MSYHLEVQILRFFRVAKKHQLPPTLRELANFARSDVGSIHYAVECLVEKGKLVRPRRPGTSRNIFLRGQNGK